MSEAGGIVGSPRSDRDPARVCSELRQRFETEIAACEQRSNRFSLLRLLSFIGCATFCTLAWNAGVLSLPALLAVVLGAVFFGAVVLQQRVLVQAEQARIRRDIHDRHLKRIAGEWNSFPNQGEYLVPVDHPYAFDIDLVGPGSLFQRIDVTHTVLGERALADWLSRPAPPATIRARQAAVSELTDMVELRQELEAGALAARGGEKLDGSPFRRFAELPSLFAQKPWLRPAICVLPLLTLASYLLLPQGVWLLPLSAQIALRFAFARQTREALNLAAARAGSAGAFERMLAVTERAPFQSALLVEIKARLAVGGTPPSEHMRSFKAWTSAAELHEQFLWNITVGALLLGDLQVLWGLERWNTRVGRSTADWFAALGELEALCSLATLSFGDPEARMPEIAEPGQPLLARGLGHPLIQPDARIDNDVQLPGPGSALIVTGSNMAGKSTLLRAVGLNAALALAGGPVCAESFRLPPVRLRASMRIDDSLQRGASYFHAELQKLRSVVDDAAAEPKVLFLLDELLRGTNARARHLGARAVLVHLLGRGAFGLVATHDVALSELEREYTDRVRNAHFTDVIEGGEMRFDYRLRPGVVRTSNALRLLALAGIDVPNDDSVAFDPLGAPAQRQTEGR